MALLPLLDLALVGIVVAGAAAFLAWQTRRGAPSSPCHITRDDTHARAGTSAQVVVGPALARAVERARRRAGGTQLRSS